MTKLDTATPGAEPVVVSDWPGMANMLSDGKTLFAVGYNTGPIGYCNESFLMRVDETNGRRTQIAVIGDDGSSPNIVPSFDPKYLYWLHEGLRRLELSP
ncbi:MAG: hypothetical protein KIT84_13885 [Labilithrix sp.]|nr:hypothetical protein [Labilithrix sp.]MCW5812110.1 hypothetical protein [Labilithrix sp.]